MKTLNNLAEISWFNVVYHKIYPKPEQMVILKFPSYWTDAMKLTA